jgi:hypothetical protein
VLCALPTLSAVNHALQIVASGELGVTTDVEYSVNNVRSSYDADLRIHTHCRSPD